MIPACGKSGMLRVRPPTKSAAVVCTSLPVIQLRLWRASPQSDRAQNDSSYGEGAENEQLNADVAGLLRVVGDRVEGIDRVRERQPVADRVEHVGHLVAGDEDAAKD